MWMIWKIWIHQKCQQGHEMWTLLIGIVKVYSLEIANYRYQGPGVEQMLRGKEDTIRKYDL